MPRPRKAINLHQRLKGIYDLQRRRAAKHGAKLDYTLEDLIALCTPLPACIWCRRPNKVSDFQLDHKEPVANGGAFSLKNLRPICASDNRRKGRLSEERYRELLALLATWDEASRRDVLMRLAAGGGWCRRRGFY